jgi:glutathione S-transferase
MRCRGSSTSTRRSGARTRASSAAADTPTIADIRLAATLEFLAVTDTGIPRGAKDYIARVESALGDAYSEPRGDVRGYVAQATGEAVAAN